MGGAVISDENIAKQINDLMLDIFQRVDASCEMVKQTCPPDEAAAYVKATARVVGPIVFDVLEVLYDKHPELKPAKWDD
jgi:hypothetical protein